MLTDQLFWTHRVDHSRSRHLLLQGSRVIWVHLNSIISKFKSIGFDQYSKYALKSLFMSVNLLTPPQYINPNFNCQMEKIAWSPYEDSILQLLRQHRKMSRWADIAHTLATQFQIKGRNGKMCRQRYQEVFESNPEGSNWPFSQEKYLFNLHNELGNKWAIISRKMNGRSDNCIKNHFYSRLRKGLKKMNLDVEQNIGKRYKEIKFNVLFKIIEASQDGFKNNYFCEADTSRRCFEIKNKLIALSYDKEEEHDFDPESINCVELYDDINDFNRNYKRKPKKFRRIPTKSFDLKQRQSSQDFGEPKSTHDVISEQSERQDNQMGQEEKKEVKLQKQLSIDNEPLFGSFASENYKIKELKSGKKRRESAETTGIEEVLCGSGILEQEPNLPLLGLGKKGTSYLSLLSEQLENQNAFFEQCDLNSESFLLKDLMSIKRLSHTESGLFD